TPTATTRGSCCATVPTTWCSSRSRNACWSPRPCSSCAWRGWRSRPASASEHRGGADPAGALVEGAGRRLPAARGHAAAVGVPARAQGRRRPHLSARAVDLHGPGQAHGLCFSVQPGTPVPPSLQNIYKELQRDLGIAPPDHGCLLPWALQGVLLLNAVLTVEDGRPGSHAGQGWEGFTDHVVETLAREREGLVFLLWGSYAQKKGAVIDPRRHRVLRAPHPSPLSAHRGFLGCGHFSAANEYLARRGVAPVDWRLPPRADLRDPAVPA